jgi:4-amino-4-deoxy-L-arabinose transferase-like glycosyltransferase
LYVYNGIGYSGYEPFLVFVQILVGPAPYGIHLLNSLMFMAASVLLYKMARRSYGSAPALVGLAIMLFLPSLVSWSVSALKESFFLILTVIVVLAAMQVVRARPPVAKIVAVVVVLTGLRFIESVRPGGLTLTASGLALGYAIRIMTLRRSVQVGVAIAAVVATAYVWQRGVPPSIDSTIARFARYHRGHVFTPGHSYKLLDQVFYSDFFGSHARVSMSPDEMGRYVVRAAVNYISQPTPWNVTSKAELLFMPEQLVWYLLVLLFPVSAVFAFRRDALLTCLLAGYSITNAAVLAMNSGNVGTLVRHRALVVPFFVWICAVGVVQLLTRKAAIDASH